jgi:hypothetical protein
MVEIEIGVLRSQCLDRRIEHRAQLIAEIAAWSASAMLPALPSNGCSPPSAPAPNSLAPIQTRPKSHNPCAEVLGRRGCEPGIDLGRDFVVDRWQDYTETQRESIHRQLLQFLEPSIDFTLHRLKLLN